MVRKLKWNTSLENPEANVVHEVVRSYISSPISNQENQLNQQNISLTNVVTNVDNSLLINVDSNVDNNAISDVDSSVLIDISNSAPSNLITNVNTDVKQNVELNVPTTVLTSAPRDILSNANNSVLTNVTSNISDDKENNFLTSNTIEDSLTKATKKREKFKRDPLSNSVAAMAQWHTKAEQKVYEVMYKETIMHRQRTRYFSYKELSTKTGLRNNRTIINAVTGLEEKKSIDILTSRRGEKLGREYLIYPPHEILSRRRELCLKIHSQTKKILTTS
jgi:hypothetical protein